MDKYTMPKCDAARRPVLHGVLRLVEAHRSAFGQARVFARANALVVGQLLTLGRHTITQSLITLGHVQEDWSAFYRLLGVPRVDGDELRRCLLRETLAEVPVEAPYVVAMDGVQVPRSSRTMPGTSWLKAPRTPVWKAGIHRAQRFLDLAWVTPRSAEGYSRAVPLWWEPAVPEKGVRPAGLAAQREWEAGLAGVSWVRQELDARGRKAQQVLALGDGVYDTVGLWTGLPERVVVLARTAKNRVLFALPEATTRRGRPRTYGERARRPQEWLGEKGGWQRTMLTVRGRTIPVTYRVEGPYVRRLAGEHPVFLLVVKGVDRRVNGRRREREPVFLLVSAVQQNGRWGLPLPAEELLAWAWQRWEIEVTHRACKAEFGVGEIQCWGERSALLAVQWQVWVVSLLLLAGYRAWGLGPGTVRPPGRWWNGSGRWSFGRLWQGFRQDVWGSEEFRRVCTGTGVNWVEKEQWLLAREHAVQGLRRA